MCVVNTRVDTITATHQIPNSQHHHNINLHADLDALALDALRMELIHASHHMRRVCLSLRHIRVRGTAEDGLAKDARGLVGANRADDFDDVHCVESVDVVRVFEGERDTGEEVRVELGAGLPRDTAAVELLEELGVDLKW